MSSIRISLDRLLDAHGITRYELGKRINVRFQTIDKYYKNKVVRYDSDLLLRMCVALDCGIDELIEVTKDETEGPSE